MGVAVPGVVLAVDAINRVGLLSLCWGRVIAQPTYGRVLFTQYDVLEPA